MKHLMQGSRGSWQCPWGVSFAILYQKHMLDLPQQEQICWRASLDSGNVWKVRNVLKAGSSPAILPEIILVISKWEDSRIVGRRRASGSWLMGTKQKLGSSFCQCGPVCWILEAKSLSLSSRGAGWWRFLSLCWTYRNSYSPWKNKRDVWKT